MWIDIFPIDRVPDDIETFRRLYDSLYLLMKFNLGIRRVHTISSSRFPLRRRIKIWAAKRLHPRLIKRDPVEIVEDMNTLIGLVSREHSHHSRYAAGCQRPFSVADTSECDVAVGGVPAVKKCVLV